MKDIKIRKTRKMKNLIKTTNKKGWLRIAEAFVSVMLVLGVILIIIARQNNKYNDNAEIEKFGDYIIGYISKDNALMNDALLNKTDSINQTLARMIPPNLNFYVRICPYNDICSNNEIITGYVYSNEILIPPSLTSSLPSATKMKIFLWKK